MRESRQPQNWLWFIYFEYFYLRQEGKEIGMYLTNLNNETQHETTMAGRK